MTTPDPEAPEADAAEQSLEVPRGAAVVDDEQPQAGVVPTSMEVDDGDRAESAIEVDAGDDDYR